MSDAIIVLNAGSSSLKFSLYAVLEREPSLESRGQIEGLGAAPHFMVRDRLGQLLAEGDPERPSGCAHFGHAEAFAYVAEWMRQEYGSRLAPVAVGHRVTHGGADFAEPVPVDATVLAELERLIPLVPLHQPHNLAGIKSLMRLRPDLPQVACFDTAFHRGRALVTERFGLPDELFRRGVRRWGFHGLSYQSIAEQFRRLAPDIAEGRVVVAHLGSGASLCAMQAGRSIDTTMGFSTLDGLPMGTRCGSLDPGVILFLLQHHGREEIESMLYTRSGLLGISGISNDLRELLSSEIPRAAEAVDFFVYRVVREIGSMVAALGGLDALIFTAGIGENSPVVRRRVCERLEWLGIEISPGANERGRGRISPPGRSPSVWVIPTDEEGAIAAGTLAVLHSGMAATTPKAAGTASPGAVLRDGRAAGVVPPIGARPVAVRPDGEGA